jgi:hypothetical protein
MIKQRRPRVDEAIRLVRPTPNPISKFPGQSRGSLIVHHLSAKIGGRQCQVPCTQPPRIRPPSAYSVRARGGSGNVIAPSCSLANSRRGSASEVMITRVNLGHPERTRNPRPRS